MSHLFLTFAVITVSTSALGLFGLLRLASTCSREEDFERNAVRFASVAPISSRSTLAFSPAL